MGMRFYLLIAIFIAIFIISVEVIIEKGFAATVRAAESIKISKLPNITIPVLKSKNETIPNHKLISPLAGSSELKILHVYPAVAPAFVPSDMKYSNNINFYNEKETLAFTSHKLSDFAIIFFILGIVLLEIPVKVAEKYDAARHQEHILYMPMPV